MQRLALQLLVFLLRRRPAGGAVLAEPQGRLTGRRQCPRFRGGGELGTAVRVSDRNVAQWHRVNPTGLRTRFDRNLQGQRSCVKSNAATAAPLCMAKTVTRTWSSSSPASPHLRLFTATPAVSAAHRYRRGVTNAWRPIASSSAVIAAIAYTGVSSSERKCIADQMEASMMVEIPKNVLA